ncbi:uncharacterized protein UBRO_20687 [Ustilago bromivora]|uniref:Reverse transcriptase domain-containing protein n=1 Tax=Ustilago bromivora TaxID=307758 RepID=A0A1K0G5L0_9BASI|nr:uncharacterized protein UBRO_20687 [Ustilago bromivora]
MCTPSRCCSSSPPLSSASHLPAHMDHNPGSFTTASLVLALEARFSHLEQWLDSQLGELITTIRALQVQSQTSPTQPLPQVLTSSSQALLPPSPPQPQAPPAAVLAIPSAGQTSGTSGELPSLPLTHCFPWVPLDIVQQVKHDQLKPEHLVKLCNLELRVSKEPSQLTHLTVGPGGVLVGAKESSDICTSAFVKAIPTIATLTQIWLVYITIRVHATGNLTLNKALLMYLEHLIECDHLYQCRTLRSLPQVQHGPTMPWLQPPPCMPALPAQASDDTMSDGRWQGYHQPSPQEGDLMVSTPSHSGDMPLAVPHRSEPTSAPPLSPGRLYNAPHRSECSSAPSHLPGQHSIEPTQSVVPQATSLRSETLFEPSSLPGRLTISPSSPGQHTAAPSLPGQRTTAPLSCPLLDTFPAGIVDLSPDLASDLLLSLIAGSILLLPRPNTLCEHPIFDATDTPVTLGTLQLCLWSAFLDLYPDQAFTSQLQGALQHGVKLGYDSPLQHDACLDVVNLPMDSNNVHHLCHEIETRLAEGCLRHVTDPVSMRLVCLPVGVVPKPHSDKRRTIYDLSHPREPGTRLSSINDGINTSFVTIHYESLDMIMDFIHEHPSASLWKADLEDAFRHVIVAESDARLMGIHFDGRYYQECALMFGGCLSPFLFNLFAEFLHWLAAFTLQAASPSPTSHSDMSHYLDDFFGASDTTASPATPIQVFSLSAAVLGFKLSHKKMVWDTTKLEILGIELDSVAQTASITQQ